MRKGITKGNEFFAIYTMQDEIVTTKENYEELAKFLNKTKGSIKSSISRIRNGLINKVIDNKGNQYQIFIYKKGEE